jgi:hypothetical protein
VSNIEQRPHRLQRLDGKPARVLVRRGVDLSGSHNVGVIVTISPGQSPPAKPVSRSTPRSSMGTTVPRVILGSTRTSARFVMRPRPGARPSIHRTPSSSATLSVVASSSSSRTGGLCRLEVGPVRSDDVDGEGAITDYARPEETARIAHSGPSRPASSRRTCSTAFPTRCSTRSVRRAARSLGAARRDRARVVRFLVADASSYITGQVWAVNGGQEM